jgi:hypothetical protein
MQTTVDIDDALLRQAKEQARKQGKSFDTLLEDALRTVMTGSLEQKTHQGINSVSEALDSGDPFFAALDEIRSLGRTSSPMRAVDLAE